MLISDVYTCIADLANALDRVSREKLWEVL